MTLLRMEQVNAYYGYIHALKDVSIHVPEGKIVSILGANGAGKTTLLKIISGQLKSESGKLLLQGKDLMLESPEKIVRHGIVQCPEGRQIFPEFTVHENLKVGAYARKDRANIDKDIERVFDYFPILKQRYKQIAGTLSGGEQQMLAIGRALMGAPKILLLDEPSLGLAPLIVKNIFEIIQDINRTGMTVVLVEQNAYQALAISHEAYILETGKVILSGEAESLRNDERVKLAYLGGH